jgi:carbon-monoxide dehydrogenase large subunit
MTAGNPRHAGVLTVKTGVKRDGTIVARQLKAVFNGGAYGAFKPVPTVNVAGASHGGGSYRVPNLAIESYCVYTNQVPCGHMRAPGAPQVLFAVESHTDMVAEALRLDPLEFRLKNALVDGDESALGERFQEIKEHETLKRAAEAAGWGEPKPGPYVGRGMSVYDRRPGGGPSTAVISVDASGQVGVLTAVPDQGGGIHTVLRQLVAEELSIPPDSVRITVGNTDTMPPDGGVGGSRTTHSSGQAGHGAAKELKERLLDVAAEMRNWPRDRLALRGGTFLREDQPQERIRERRSARRPVLLHAGGSAGRDVVLRAGRRG